MSSWLVVIHGQPASGNENEIQRGYRRGKDGSNVPYSRVAKNAHVKAYIDGAIPVIRTARPSGWIPPEKIRVDYRLYLSRDMDFDNVMKIVDDALKVALGVDDSRFYPTAISKELDMQRPRVWLGIGAFVPCACCGR